MKKAETSMGSLKNPVKWKVSVVELCLVLLLTIDSTTGGTVVNCSAQNYPGTPCSTPLDTTILDLSYNNIERIELQDFSLLKGLRKLFLQFNRISSVNPQAFSANPALEYLDISHNRLPQISSLPFSNLRALTYLDISNNAEVVLHLSPTISLLKDLQVLKLGNPHLTSFRKDSFQGLSSLKLKEFLLITGDFTEYEPTSLMPLHNLERLTLELNMWKNLDKLTLMSKDIVNSTNALTIRHLNVMWSKEDFPFDKIFANSIMKVLSLQNISINGNYCTPLISFLLTSRVEEIIMDTLHTNGSCIPYIAPFKRYYVKKFTIKDLDNPRFIFFFPQQTLAKFLQNITDIFVINIQQYFFPCELSDSLVSLRTLDLTKNALQEETLFPECVKPFPVIRSLTIDYNKFQHLGFLSSVTLHMKDLVNFSASYNKIHLESQDPLIWTKSLRRLNLRGNQLSDKVLSKLPESLEMLDLSFNDIKTITNMVPMKNLVELYLSGNQLKSMPELSLFTSINLLHVDQNDIAAFDTNPIRSSSLTELKFGHNPFNCDCDILNVREFCETTSMSIIDWPAGFTCKTPENLNGTELQHVSYSWATCHSGAFVFIMLFCTGVIGVVLYIIAKRQKRCQYSSVSTQG